MRRVAVLAGCLAALTAGATARQATGAAGAGQAQAPQSLTAEVNGYYTTVAGFISRAAAQVPAEMYTFQPTPEVRSFARLFAHITDDNNGACAALAGVTPSPARVDAGSAGAWAADKMTKADLEKGLNDSIALCQKAFAALTPANMSESAGGRGNRTRFGNLIYNTSHINEHYGNLVTYMRLKGMVPPSSAPRGGGPAPR
jgi:hypothetical protein